MADIATAAVTGAFGYLGRYVARRLLTAGVRVKTLTGHPHRHDPLAERLDIVPFHFDDPGRLVEDLTGVDVLFNTYWVRFARGRVSHGQAVANSKNLIQAAAQAGVKRFIHVSITNPDLASPLPYFRGKAAVEQALQESGLSYGIVRPTVLFGAEDILVNNIAWLLRRLPLFGVFGRGDYRLQPVSVDDVAGLMVELGMVDDDQVVDAVGPETYTFEQLVRLVARRVGSRATIIHVSPLVARVVASLLGVVVRDVIITRDEIDGLMSGLLVSPRPPTCPTRFSTWVAEHGGNLGRRYASELRRHFRGLAPVGAE